jgi:nucleotide-binding universal stress UspA family protein
MGESPRTYLVVVDGTPECRLALRYAARRAVQTQGALALLHVIRPVEFMPLGGVQDAIEAETRENAETLLGGIAAEIRTASGLDPVCLIRRGQPAAEVLAALKENGDISLLVLGAAAKGAPGPLVAFFAGEGAGTMPCPVVVVPGGMSEDAIDRLA